MNKVYQYNCAGQIEAVIFFINSYMEQELEPLLLWQGTKSPFDCSSFSKKERNSGILNKNSPVLLLTGEEITKEEANAY